MRSEKHFGSNGLRHPFSIPVVALFLILAANLAVSLPCQALDVPLGGNSQAIDGGPNFTINVKNTTGKIAYDFTLTIYNTQGNPVPNIVMQDQASFTHDKVDDDNSGTLDNGESDTLLNPAATTCRSIITDNYSIANNQTITINFNLSAVVPVGATRVKVRFSTKDESGVHRDMLAAVIQNPAIQELQIPVGTHLGYTWVTNGQSLPSSQLYFRPHRDGLPTVEILDAVVDSPYQASTVQIFPQMAAITLIPALIQNSTVPIGFGLSNPAPNDSGTKVQWSFTPFANLDVMLSPINPPITIPNGGGAFSFNAAVVDQGPIQIPFVVWARNKFPDGTYSGNTLGPVTINPPVGMQLSRVRIQNVPASWPAGVHTYLGYANTSTSYPATDSSYFTWVKTSTMDGRPDVSNALCWGDLFDGEVLNVAAPTTFVLQTPMPNPFNATTVISFELRVPSQVRLTVWDTAGRLVATLVDGWREAGENQVTFDGSQLASGVYLVQLDAGEFEAVQKVVLLK